MGKNAKTDWAALEHDILRKLDVIAEYKAMGVEFTTTTPRASGWVECYGAGRDDNKPSAAVCVDPKANGEYGRYKDHGTGECIRMFEFAARHGGRGPDFRAAREYFAAKVGVKITASRAKKKPEEYRIIPLVGDFPGGGGSKADAWLKYWASQKSGVSINHIARAGGEVTWGDFGLCVRFFGYLPGKWDKPAATLLYHTSGRPFAAYGDLPERRFHLVGGSQTSLMLVGSPADLESAMNVLLTEGLTDALAAAPYLPAGWIAATGTCGADSFGKELAEAFRGKRVWMVGDADTAGQRGAAKRARDCFGVASEIRICTLPYEVTEKRGRDLRDLVNEGGFAMWLAEVEAIPALETMPALPEPDPAAAGEAGGEKFALPIKNAEEKQVTNDDGTISTVKSPFTMSMILDRMYRHTDGWPCRVDQALFVPRDGGVDWLTGASSLFGWLQGKAGHIWWYGNTGCITKEEFFCETRRTAKQYLAVEDLPHEPTIDGHYYACGKAEPGDGSTLRELLERFSPATNIDRDLLQAALMTLFWGGHGGTRPVFLFTTDDGRGVGKSKSAEMLARVAGGIMSFSNNEPINEIKARLLSPDALTKRVALLDNVKSLKFSWGELEALITAPVISGKRMYVGEASRPNTITWFITLNGASMSTDMAQRCIPIKVKRPTRSGNWEEDTLRFVLDNRQRLIADLIGCLRERAQPLEKYSRWATWEKAVLSRLPDPGEAQKVIEERQGATDVEADEAVLIEEFFAGQLRLLGYTPEREYVLIPSAVAARWLNWATNEQHKTIAAGRILGQLCDEKRLPLHRPTSKTMARGVIWQGREAQMTTPYLDLERRMKEKMEREKQKKAEQENF